MQDFKKSADKQRLFNDFNAGRVRVLIGSSETMGTGVNVQQRLKALHHLDVPWLPSQIEQREGRIERQGNQHDEIEIYAYATLGSMDATMWQNNERKARFIAAALSGDRSIRRLEEHRQPGQPVRHGQGDRLGRQPADAEGRAGKRDRPAANASARRISTTSRTSAAASSTPAHDQADAGQRGSRRSGRTLPAEFPPAAKRSRWRSGSAPARSAGQRAPCC